MIRKKYIKRFWTYLVLSEMQPFQVFISNKYSVSDLHFDMATFVWTSNLLVNILCSDHWRKVGWSPWQWPPVNEDRWAVKNHSLFLGPGTVNISSRLRKTTKRQLLQILAQKHAQCIKPDNVGCCIKEFYQLFDKKAGVTHNFKEGKGKWTCDLFLGYLWQGAMQRVPVAQCWGGI